MIKSFQDKACKAFYTTGKSRTLPPDIQKVALRKLDYLNNARDLNDLKIPPANRLEGLKGDLKGYYSIRVNKQFRVIFRFEDNNAYDVKIVDYH